jgi:hypothetical protein
MRITMTTEVKIQTAIVNCVCMAWRENRQAILMRSVDDDEAGKILLKIVARQMEPVFKKAYQWSSGAVDRSVVKAMKRLWRPVLKAEVQFVVRDAEIKARVEAGRKR